MQSLGWIGHAFSVDISNSWITRLTIAATDGSFVYESTAKIYSRWAVHAVRGHWDWPVTTNSRAVSQSVARFSSRYTAGRDNVTWVRDGLGEAIKSSARVARDRERELLVTLDSSLHSSRSPTEYCRRTSKRLTRSGR